MYPMDWLDGYRIGRSIYEDKLVAAAEQRLLSAVQPRRPLGARMQALVATLALGLALLGLGGLAQGR